MNNNVGLRSLIPVTTDDDIKEQQAARAAVEKRIGESMPALQAAPKPSIADTISDFTPQFLKPIKVKTKDEIYKENFEKEYGDAAVEKRIRDKIRVNKRAGKAEYEGFADHEMIVGEIMADKAKKNIAAAQSKTNSLMAKAGVKMHPSLAKNKKNLQQSKNTNGLDGRMMVDPKHPDGFRFTHVNDLYRQYGDNPERYIQEVMYLYEDAPPPTAGVVKTYDHLDASTYPSNQANDLKKYQNSFSKLNPQQQKIVGNNMRSKSAVGKRTLTKKEPEKLFESIIDNLGKKK